MKGFWNSSVVKSIVDFLLRKWTLNSMIFLFVAFIVSEITAISASDSIENFCDKYSEIYPSGILNFIIEVIRVLYTDGSIWIVIMATFAVSPIIYLKSLELASEKSIIDRSKVHPFWPLLGVLLFSVFGLVYTGNKFKKEAEVVDIFCDLYKGSSNSIESFRFEQVNFCLKSNGVFKMEGKQTNGRMDDWEGYLKFKLLDVNGNVVDEIETKKFICPAKSLVSKGEKRSKSIVYDTMISQRISKKVVHISVKEFSKPL